MLGSAPGTDLLNEWVDAINDGMSLSDIAESIAASDAFTTAYPTFLTNEEFATDFLNNLMGTEEVSAALVSAAVGIVTGLLNDGMTRGALAIAVFQAMYEIHDQGEAHAAYGDLGMVANGLFNKVAVAEYYTVDLRQASSNSRVLRDVNSETGLADIMDSISDHLDPPEPILLTNQRDNIVGTAANDLIIAEPDKNGNDTLDPFDVIDGGPGSDSLEVYASGTEDIEIDANGADVTNVERAYLSTRGAINVDLTGWEGLETVELGRFGATSDVAVKVAGASVGSARTFGGGVTITGAGGEVDIAATKDSAVQINSGAHTTSVMVKGGASVDVNSAASASSTVTSVSLDGVQRSLGADGARGDNVDVKTITIAAGNDGLTPSATETQYVTWDGTNATAVTDADATANMYYVAADQPDAATTNLVVGQVVVTTDKTMADGYDAEGADGVSVHVYSKAIESFSVSNTDAIILVQNAADDAADLSLTVNKYGKHAKGAVSGKLCLNGDGTAENIMINVMGDSDFALASDAVKSISVSGSGALTLDVNEFDPATAGPSGTLESLTLGGSGKFTLDADGLAKLKTIDASGASGDVVITKIGASVMSYDGGSAFDCIGVSAHATGGITVDLGAGNDIFKSGASNSKSRVDGGDGMDTLQLTSATGYTYTPQGGRPTSIYSNFEVLDVGGSETATYNVALLGVSSVVVSESTADSDPNTAGLQASVVSLMGMGDGMGISVNGKGASGTTASIVHDMPEREAGSARYSGELDVNLTANGGATDTKTAMGTTGEAMLTLQVDAEIEVLNVNSSANAGGARSAANARPSAGNYANTLALDTGATVEAINVSGNAMLMITEATAATEFAALELVDAEDNTGGVTIAVDSAHAEDMDMLGGSGGDSFTGGAGDDTIRGNGGKDTLIGAAGADTIRGGAGMDTMTGGAGGTVGTGANAVTDRNIFQYTAASESSLSFSATGAMQGFDTITDWGTASNNVISLGRTLFGSLSGAIKAEVSGNDDFSVNDADGDAAADSMRALIGDGDGFFETGGVPRTDGQLGNTPVVKHSIAVVREELVEIVAVVDDPGTPEDETVAPRAAVDRTWIFIDVDGDGDYTAGTDMAIALTGSQTIEAGDFSA